MDEEPKEMKVHATVKDAAAYYSVKAETIRRMIRDGRLCAKKINKRDWRFISEPTESSIQAH